MLMVNDPATAAMNAALELAALVTRGARSKLGQAVAAKR
jgi:hypothetical protein